MADQNEENSESQAEETQTEEVQASENAESNETKEAPAATPDFPELQQGEGANAGVKDLSRFKDVQVVVSAELGRTDMPIQELLGMSEGSVFTLNRTVTSPIELLAQGIPLGNGEVVVVDDVFAVRIKEIYSNN